MWQKITETESKVTTDLLLLLSGLLILIGAITKREILFLIAGLFALYLIMTRIYDKKVGQALVLQNPRTAIRLFPKDEAKVIFHFENKALFPYLNGTLKMEFGDAITIQHPGITEEKDKHLYEMPLAMIGNGSTVLEIPIQANQRGTAKITNISYRFAHLCKFHSVLLTLIPFYHQEIIVYPRPIPVRGMDAYFQTAPGVERALFSPFEDTQNWLGTRDYHSGDSFNRINWQASVKMQRWQTTTYERVVDGSCVFIINLQSSHLAGNQLEKRLSHVAFLCAYATKKGYPFEIFLNARRPGNAASIHVPEGNGIPHYMEALETLARIHRQPMTSPFAAMVYHIERKLTQSKTVILIGDMPTEAQVIMEPWHKRHLILRVEELSEGAVLVPLRKGVTHATSS